MRRFAPIAVAMILLGACGEPTPGEERQDAFDRALERDPIIRDFYDGELPDSIEPVRPDEPFPLSDLEAALVAGRYELTDDGAFFRCIGVAWGGGGEDESQLLDYIVLAWRISSSDGLVEHVAPVGEQVDSLTIGQQPVETWGC